MIITPSSGVIGAPEEMVDEFKVVQTSNQVVQGGDSNNMKGGGPEVSNTSHKDEKKTLTQKDGSVDY